MPKILPSKNYPSIEELQKVVKQPLKSLEVVRQGTFVARSTFFIALMLISLAALVLWVPWQQTSFGAGSVIPFDPSERLQELHAPVKGLIERWHVVEGAKVNEGDPVAEITDIDPQLFDRLETQASAARAALEAVKTAVETSSKNLERQRLLAAQGLKSQRDYELAQLEYQKYLADRAAKEKELTDIQVKLSRQSSQVIKATRSGQIMRIFFPQGGSVVKQGDTLATLAPLTDKRIVELFIKGMDLPLVAPNRRVRLQFEGWPAIQFSGWPSVAVGTFGGIVHNVDPSSDDGKGLFRIFVWPDPNDNPWPESTYLRQGVRVKGWILLETVPLGYELWRQFNGFPPVIKNKSKKDSGIMKQIKKQISKLAK